MLGCMLCAAENGFMLCDREKACSTSMILAYSCCALSTMRCRYRLFWFGCNTYFCVKLINHNTACRAHLHWFENNMLSGKTSRGSQVRVNNTPSSISIMLLVRLPVGWCVEIAMKMYIWRCEHQTQFVNTIELVQWFVGNMTLVMSLSGLLFFASFL